MVQYEFGSKIRSPFYLFSGLILIAGLLLLLVIANIQTQKEKAKFVADPQVGDVYLVRDFETGTRSYYFLRIARINGDSVLDNGTINSVEREYDESEGFDRVK